MQDEINIKTFRTKLKMIPNFWDQKNPFSKEKKKDINNAREDVYLDSV